MVLASNVMIDRYLFNIKVGLFDTLNIFKSLNTNSLTASGKGHRRRSVRFPAAKDRALRGALGKGPPRARLLPELNGGTLAQRFFPRRTSPGVPESAPPGALWGETDCVGTLWGYSAGKEWGVIMPEEYIIYSQGKKADVFMSWEY